ncbi:MAG TPA: toll/interleukin-1 receptor domain-containing protein [Segetibacter sp.]|nr:toll/interleukin-1 receptor domain-containing protein [Segetibacter sp.]
MQKIFFSYSRADGSEFALRLAVDLKKKGFDVWIDQEDIRAGLKWDAEIEKALESCDCLLYLETEKSVVSTNVLDEVYYAMEQNKKVIPLIFVDSRTPFRLKRLQHIDFTQNYHTALALLVNELEGATDPVSYLHDEHPPPVINPKPSHTKLPRLLLLIGCIAVVLIAVVLLTTTNRRKIVSNTKAAILLTDTSTNSEGMRSKLPSTSLESIAEAEISTPATSSLNKKRNQGKTVPERTENLLRKTGVTIAPTEKTKDKLNEIYNGDWRLVSMKPKASLQQGYIKIEALSENQANIKTYIQFYYPERKATSYLTIFNAFAGCTSCQINKEMKLKAEDVAVGSRTIKIRQQDEADGGKAGDVILDANSNKSIHASVTLRFDDNSNATIQVQQPLTIALANELMLEPFVYTFRFKKND